MSSQWTHECPFTTDDKVRNKRVIGEGGFGMVFQAEHEDWGLVAIKEVKSHVNTRYANKFLEEISRHASLRHPHVVQFLGYLNGPVTFGIVMECHPIGSLADVVDNMGPFTDTSWLKLKEKWSCDIAVGMNYLHTRSPVIIHRDLKLGNILLDRGFKAMITDFGLSETKRLTGEYDRSSDNLTGGTLAYTAPEIFHDINTNPTKAMDVYAYSILLWELFTEKIAFDRMEANLIRSSVLAGQRPSIAAMRNTPQHMVTMTTTCWKPDPAGRPTFADIKKTLEVVTRQAEYQRSVNASVTQLMVKLSQVQLAHSTVDDDRNLETDCSPSVSAELTSNEHRSLLQQAPPQPQSMARPTAQPSQRLQQALPSSGHRPATKIAGDAQQATGGDAEGAPVVVATGRSEINWRSQQLPSNSAAEAQMSSEQERSTGIKYPQARAGTTQMYNTDYSGLGIAAPEQTRVHASPPSLHLNLPDTPSGGVTVDLHPRKPDTARIVLDNLNRNPGAAQSSCELDTCDGKSGTCYSDRVLTNLGSVESANARAALDTGACACEHDEGPTKPDPCEIVRQNVQDIENPNALAAIAANCGPGADIEKPWKGLPQRNLVEDSAPYAYPGSNSSGATGGSSSGDSSADKDPKEDLPSTEYSSCSSKESIKKPTDSSVFIEDNPSGSSRVVHVTKGDNSRLYNITSQGGGIQIGDNNTMFVGPQGSAPYYPRMQQAVPSRRGQPHRGNAATPNMASQQTPPTKKVVKITVPPKVVHQEVMDYIARDVGSKWRRLGRRLGFSDGELDAIHHDNQASGLHEVIYQMMQEWLNRNGDAATLKVLAEALIRIEKPNMAKELAKF